MKINTTKNGEQKDVGNINSASYKKYSFARTGRKGRKRYLLFWINRNTSFYLLFLTEGGLQERKTCYRKKSIENSYKNNYSSKRRKVATKNKQLFPHGTNSHYDVMFKAVIRSLLQNSFKVLFLYLIE